MLSEDPISYEVAKVGKRILMWLRFQLQPNVFCQQSAFSDLLLGREEFRVILVGFVDVQWLSASWLDGSRKKKTNERSEHRYVEFVSEHDY